ncbi:hypothetical protein ACIRPJ_33265 [Streptomyces asoensis]|uniref:hypothetical protein n=1 Tax=Streptomyces asoensis TaxID=249586 RepID=UPI001678FA98|nr:hypothetical protein [Streptomyces asoensis]GGQ97450.1 hypothetical protein GCM10010496_72980 [Streptomyces asoensis]
MAKMKSRIATLLAATAMTVGASVTLGTTDAAAASWTFQKSSVSSDGSFSIVAYNDGSYAGVMVWNADPGCCDIPGDAFNVYDKLADGWGMEASMIIPISADRVATTRGHGAGYTSPWNTGNLAEGTEVAIQLCAVKGEAFSCSAAYTGHA